MARVAHGIEKAIRLYAENGNAPEVDILFGSLPPGGDGAEQDDAPIGSVYLKTSGEFFQKTKDDKNLSDWELLLKDDYHSGYYFIPTSKTITVLENKQMTTFGTLTIAGDLLAEGEVIIEE